MENKNNILIAVVCLVLGVLVGFLMWGNNASRNMDTRGMHVMHDGSMMKNGEMDMAAMMSSMNANLAGKKGDEFDKAFIQEMIVHHEGAVEMAELARTNAKHAEIKTLAEAIITAQTSEINQMKTWLKNWYNISQ